MAIYVPLTPAFAISQAQINLYKQGILYYDIDACSATANSTLYGKDNPEKIWNYFKTQGMDDAHIAAVMGNIQQESGFNPTIMQKGGTSNDPVVADPGGWGLVQWTPGSKVLTTASEYNVTGSINELSTQLQVIWAEMNGTTPAGATNFMENFTNTSTLEEATAYFANKYEAAGDPRMETRITFAQQALARYGGSPSGITASSGTTGCTGSFVSPDCITATGTAKILCAAKAYDTTSYFIGIKGGHQGGAAWHESCSTIGPDCYLDCSGLVNMALYDLTGGSVDRRGPVADIPNEPQYWQKVTYDEIQSGDLLVKIPADAGGINHVEIIDHTEGTKIFTFGAHTSSAPQEDQVGPSQYTDQPGITYYHYIGPGL